jgi:hypothetical protein
MELMRPLRPKVPPTPSNSNAAKAAVYPSLPPNGSVTDIKTARAYLSRTIANWDLQSNEEQQRIATRLRDMCRGDFALQLARQPWSGQPRVLLDLFPGNTAGERKRAFLASITDDWKTLSFEDQHVRAVELESTHDIVVIR